MALTGEQHGELDEFLPQAAITGSVIKTNPGTDPDSDFDDE